MGKRQEAAARTRKKIVDAAAALHASRGLAHVSVDEIVQAAKVSKGSFYVYFKRKEDVAQAIAFRDFDAIRFRLDDADLPYVQRLAQFLVQSAGYIEQTGLALCQEWMKSAVHPAQEDSAGMRKLNYDVQIVTDLLEKAADAGEIQPSLSIGILADLIMAEYYGCVALWSMTNGEFSLQARMEQFCWALPGLLQTQKADFTAAGKVNFMEMVSLNDGNQIPAVGFGVFMIPNDGPTYDAVLAALKAGYRHIDTAAAYFNEGDVGRAIRDSGIPRDEIFVTSKLWLSDYGYDKAKHGIERSLRNLGLDYIDMYLLHQPYGDVEGAWKALEEAKEEGRIHSIGVSNMSPNLYEQYVSKFKTKPAVNQVECNPFVQQRELRKLMDKDDVKVECWYPLGHGDKALMNDPVIAKIAEKYGKNHGQVILRFEVQDGLITLPKSTNPAHIASNLDIFDFELTDEEMNAMRALDKNAPTHNPEAPGMAEQLMSAFVIED